MSEAENSVAVKYDISEAEVSIYCFERVIHGLRYGGEIPAVSWDEASAAVASFGGKITGRSVLTVGTVPCAICRGEVRENREHPLPLPDTDEWADVIE